MSFVIPPRQEALLAAALRPRGPAAGLFELRDVNITASEVRARFHHAERDVMVRLVHPSTNIAAASLEVGAFRVVVDDEDDAASCGPLMASLHATLSAIGDRFTWVEPRSSGPTEGDDPRGERVTNTELIAVQAGIKPALRMSVGEAQLPPTTAALVAAGLFVHRRGRWDDHDGISSDILCASPDAERAEALAELERRLHDAAGGPLDADAETAREIGTLLGYPTCCVEAHAARVAAPREGVAATFDAARRAWRQIPHARLNNVIAGLVSPLITFEPCAFDCKTALDYANSVADALSNAAADSLSALDETLARTVVVHESGARGFAELRDGVVHSVRALPRKKGDGATEDDVAALSTATGPVGDRGKIAPGAIVIDFAARR